jgi:type I restriction enzyme S subunit
LGQQLFERLEIPLPDIAEQERVASRLERIADFRTLPSPTAQLDRAVDALLREGRNRPLGESLELNLDDFAIDRDAVYERAGVLSFGRGLFAHGPMRGSQTKYAKLRRISQGQLVMSRLKAFEGAVAVAASAFDESVASQEFVTFTPKAEVDLDWLEALCRWPSFWEALRATSSGIGARRERVSADALLSLQVPYPSAASQPRIAALNRSRKRVASLEAERERIRAAILPAARNDAFAKLT